MTPIDLYRSMLRIRMVEERIVQEYPNQEIRCPVHLSIGQEAVAVGVCAALKPRDTIFSTHRCHAHYLAKGGDLYRMFAELYGRADGCCGGRGGSMHLMDPDAGVMWSGPIVGSAVPMAVGQAWAIKRSGQTDRIVVSFMGDGALEEGIVWESMNFASLHGLPILFVLEDNGYSVFAHRRARQYEGLQRAAISVIDWPTSDIADDGNNPEQVRLALCGVRSKMVFNEYPGLLRCLVQRPYAHVGTAFEGWARSDPLDLFRSNLPQDAQLDAMAPDIAREIETAIQLARAAQPARS